VQNSSGFVGGGLFKSLEVQKVTVVKYGVNNIEATMVLAVFESM